MIHRHRYEPQSYNVYTFSRGTPATLVLLRCAKCGKHKTKEYEGYWEFDADWNALYRPSNTRREVRP